MKRIVASSANQARLGDRPHNAVLIGGRTDLYRAGIKAEIATVSVNKPWAIEAVPTQ